MRPAPFTYHRAADLEHALSLLAEFGDDAKVIAGGQSLVPLLALRLASPAHLVDLARIEALRSVELRTDRAGIGDALVIGANVTQRDIEFDADAGSAVPLLADAVPLIAHPQIRNRGSVCGSIAHADPAAELPSVAIALDAIIVARSRRGERRIEAADFFVSYLETALASDEVVVAIELPIAPARSGAAFREISRRPGDFAMAGVAAAVTLGTDGRIADARLAMCGVASLPVRANAAEATLRGALPSVEVFAAAARDVTGMLDPPDDIHATSEYRRHIAGVLVQRALQAACARAVEEVSAA